MQPGDTVQIRTKKKDGEKTYTGILMPRAQIFDQNILVLKLSSGYNIGIDTSSIIEKKVLEQRKPSLQKAPKQSQDQTLPKVVMISCGGTISSRVDYRTGGVVADYDANDFISMMPELAKIATIKTVSLMQKMSEDMNPTDWQVIAKEVITHVNDPDVAGVVITQGTDTLHYTSAALSFMLENVSKPVVLTAAQRSIDRGSSDAFENVISSVQLAANFDGACVGVCMHESTSDGVCQFIVGTKVRKMHTSRRDAFQPVNARPIARVTGGKSIEIIDSSYYQKQSELENTKTILRADFEKKVGLVHVYPGMDASVLNAYDTYKGLVIGATALGHVPEQVLKKLESLAKKMVVVIATQTIYGRVHPYVYSRLRDMSLKMGIVFVNDMLAEVAYVKLGWVLANYKKTDEQKHILQTAVAHEISQELSEDMYIGKRT
ncbi:MAG: Glu-tRNA(Gln) amidotransferase subunit GatD [Candidatus Woesearchaeota archaeon]